MLDPLDPSIPFVFGVLSVVLVVIAVYLMVSFGGRQLGLLLRLTTADNARRGAADIDPGAIPAVPVTGGASTLEGR